MTIRLTLTFFILLSVGSAFAVTGHFQGDNVAQLAVLDADGNQVMTWNTVLDIVRVFNGYLFYVSDEAWFYDRLAGWDGFILDALDLATDEYALDLRDAGTSIFLVDKEGDVFVKGNLNLDSAASDLYWNDGQYIAGQLSSDRRQLWLGGTGGAKNNRLRLDFDQYDNRTTFLDAVAMNADFQFYDNTYHLGFGTGSDASTRWETSGGFDFLLHALYVGTADDSGYAVWCEKDDRDDTAWYPTAATAAGTGPAIALMSDNPSAWTDRVELYRTAAGAYLNDAGGTLWLQDSVTGAKTLAELAGRVPTGITPTPSAEGQLFLDTDATANGALVLYSNGAWRTVASW